MKKSTFFAGLVASLLLVGCGAKEDPSTANSSSTKPSTSETSSSQSSSSSSTVVTVPAESVTITGEATVKIGAELQLTATVAPETTTDKTVTWTSSDATKATVDATGKVKALALGEVTITAKCGEKETTHKITIQPILPTEVAIEGPDFVGIGKTIDFNAKLTPSNTTNKDVTWTSSDPKIASVDKDGKVKGIKAGKVTITAKSAADETKVIEKEITIATALTKIAIDGKTSEIKHYIVDGKESGNTVTTYDLGKNVTIEPATAEVKTLKWSSNNEKVAKVDENGKVTLVALGKATITAKSVVDGKASNKVTIYNQTKPTELTITHNYKPITKLELNTEDTASLYTKAKDDTESNYAIWTSSDPTIVKTSGSKITALKATTEPVTITATSKFDNTVKASIQVTVKEVHYDKLPEVTTTPYITYNLGKSQDPITGKVDGTSKSEYEFKEGTNSIKLTACTKTYFDAFDTKGNSVIKIGTGSAGGKFTIEAPQDANYIEVYVALYNPDDGKTVLNVNNKKYKITSSSYSNQYTKVIIDVKENKKVTLDFEKRAYVDKIAFSK